MAKIYIVSSEEELKTELKEALLLALQESGLEAIAITTPQEQVFKLLDMVETIPQTAFPPKETPFPNQSYSTQPKTKPAIRTYDKRSSMRHYKHR